MNFFTESKLLLKSFSYWFVILFIIGMFLFMCGPHPISLFGYSFSIPAFSTENYVSYFFKYIQIITLGDTEKIFSINPFSGFTSQLSMSFLLSFLITFPIGILTVIEYLWPALFQKEKKFILLLSICSYVLFVLGVVFSSIYIVPKTFEFLALYTKNLGVQFILDLQQFTTLFIMMTVSVGLMFLLPVFMILSSFVGVIPPSVWKENWKVVFSVIVVFSAIITPDGSGVTMVLLTLPLSLLYIAGMFISLAIYKK